MKINLKSNGKMNYLAANDAGQTIKLSGDGSAVGPMQSVLMAVAGCSSIDIELILEKMRQPLDRLEVEVDGKRAEDAVPKVFTDIHIVYTLYGDIDDKKAKKAVDMSIEKYCSVAMMIVNAAKITYEYKVVK